MNYKVAEVEISGIRKFYNKVLAVEGALSLTLGQPDFPVPLSIKKAMIEAIEKDKTTYTSNNGLYELRYEINKYLNTMNIDYSPEEICITVGGSEALFSVLSALLNPGDTILIPNPAYPAYDNISKILGANIIYYDLREDFSIDFNKLKELINFNNPKAMILSYPSNPTGACLSKQDNKELYNILKDSSITIISDEIYSSLYYGEEYNSIAQYSDLRDRVILVSGFSKMFSMTGLRIGYFCASEKYMKEIIKVHQYNVSCATSIAQWGAYEGLKYSLQEVDYMKEQFIKRRDYVFERLNSMGFDTKLPKGAFYIFPSIKKFSSNSEEFCTKLLNEAKVACVPGTAFGSKGEGYMRISYSYSIETLKVALDRMENWLKNI